VKRKPKQRRDRPWLEMTEIYLKPHGQPIAPQLMDAIRYLETWADDPEARREMLWFLNAVVDRVLLFVPIDDRDDMEALIMALEKFQARMGEMPPLWGEQWDGAPHAIFSRFPLGAHWQGIQAQYGVTFDYPMKVKPKNPGEAQRLTLEAMLEIAHEARGARPVREVPRLVRTDPESQRWWESEVKRYLRRRKATLLKHPKLQGMWARFRRHAVTAEGPDANDRPSCWWHRFEGTIRETLWSHSYKTWPEK